MINTQIHRDAAMLKGQIAALYEIFKNETNQQTAERAQDLALKLERQEYSIAFCGHFSAGKSSMINALMGENILPSSPIPTSANLVKIKAGEDYAKVFFKDERPLKFPAPYDYEKVKSYAKDGDSIQSIEISYSKTSIPEHTIIMDTPGIDSTDDAHRIATESALHLADIVFYVMDYNHVQSELNFLFTKELTEAGKEVYLVINQIDKHREEELSFISFQDSVKHSFASWGVQPAKIFYTTLKKPDHPHNQYPALKQFIEEKISERFAVLPESVYHSLKRLGEEHIHFLSASIAELVNGLNEKLEELSEEERQGLIETFSDLSEQLEELKASLKKKEIQLYESIDKVLDNAYLMPFSTRDLAEQYLAARQPDFKMGLFFAKQKTEQERQARLERFYSDLAEKVTSQIDWHIKELITRTLRESEIEEPQLLASVQNFTVSFGKELLVETVKPGAGLTGDYVLNYTNDVANMIKRKTKEQLAAFISGYLEQWKRKQSAGEQKLARELARLKGYVDASQQLDQLDEQITAAQIKLEQILTGHMDLTPYQDKFAALAVDETAEAQIVYYESAEEDAESVKPVRERGSRPVERNDSRKGTEIAPFIAALKDASLQVKDVPGFKKISEELMQKADRLENQSFTVALFGAFSAGKSSFANALIGHNLLPVSPNPTTAAINKIMPVDAGHPHGTVLVKLKSQETLMADVNRSLSAFALQAAGLDEAVRAANKAAADVKDVDAYEKTHLAFLHAFVRGIDNYRAQLGEVIGTDLEQFTGFVANEEQSCLVEWIEVYYDCELTKKGITLVDTPGADSINARHTGVAFDYIKNSDAILFVTYYNHAFSKADREFLIQLGRVKDTFALDKMFFIVNAVDLAHDEDELHDVLDYVEGQLVTYGIRQPHLYPVSSLLALKEKLAGETESPSGITLFEEKFYDFIEHDLREIAVAAAKMEWQRMIAQLHSFIHSAEEDQETKAQKREHLAAEKADMLARIIEQNSSFLQQRLKQETDELVFYIKQRVFLRYNDFLKESFNPALLKDDGRNLKKALQQALENFLTDFGYDFAQELRATTLRVEAFIGKLLTQSEQSIISSLHELNEEASFSAYELNRLDSPEFETAFGSLNRGIFKTALSCFKNPKSFFEKNERKLLGDELENNLQEPSDEYLTQGKNKLKSHYSGLLETEFNALLAHLTEQAEEFYEGALASLSNEVPIDELKKIASNLERN
ncbi:dynamin family protein [Bacillus benzoevorans]|uniref:Small GTP-binding protein n=1 Tax=Bacillus benzoevorans TaxID=1456 RepID=A0A7X0HS74_9BACI|nr:dynamin family protein [Bacillus benzoevorans]MBB6444636.1 small GTP-binding protein [Bacillus benzoevorans]